MTRLGEIWDAILRLGADEPAVEFQHIWWRWSDLARAKTQVQQLVDARFDREGARIGILTRNRAELIGPILGVLGSAKCLVTLNATYPDKMLADEISGESLAMVIGTQADLDRPGLRQAAERAGTALISVGEGRGGDHRLICEPSQAVHAADKTYNPATAIEMLSSGTTGKPKRIPMKASSFQQAVLAAAAFEAGRKEGDAPMLRSGVQLLTAPMAHISGLLALCNAIVAGRKSCLLEKFRVDAFHDAVVRHRPKVAGAPPAALKMLMDADIAVDDLSSLRAFRTGTAPLDPDLADAFFDRYGIPVLQNYGATEFGGVAGWSMEDFKTFRQQKRGAVGRVNKGISARAIDPQTGDVLPAGVQGVLELKGPQVGDGENWIRTTDIAVVDEDAFLWIKGRADGAIIRGGFKIQPEDLVNALEQHGKVREAAVVGLPDQRLGSVPVAAYIGIKTMPEASEVELLDHMRAHLTPYQIPTHVVRVEDFPRTLSLKVDQPALRQLLLDRLAEREVEI